MTAEEILTQAAGIYSPRMCAWCREPMGWDGLCTDGRTSHGICEDCAGAVFGVAVASQEARKP